MKCALTVILLLAVKLSFGTIYYVSQSTGNDSRSSQAAQNPSTPWKSLKRLNDPALILKKGDAILFKRDDVWVGQTLEPRFNGITFGAYGKGALPVIDGGRNPAISLSALRDLKIEFIAFKRTGAKGIVAQLGKAWSKANAGMIRAIVKNCYFYGGVEVQGSYNLLTDNIIDGKANDGNGNGIWEHHQYCHHNTYRANIMRNFSLRGIWTMIDTHHGLFEKNTVYNCKLAGIDLDGADYVVYLHTVKDNTVYNIQNDAIELENAFNCIVSGNKMRNGGRAYIYIINYEKCTVKDGYGAKNGIGAILNTTIANNVMIGGGADELSIAIGIYRAGGINIFNNTIYNFRSRFFDLDYSSASEVPKIRLVNNIFSTIRVPSWYGIVNLSKNDYSVLAEDNNNCFFNNGREDIYTDRVTKKQRSLKEYSSLTGKARSSISANPMFRGATDLRLKPGSPCIAAGKNVGLPFKGKAPNIGAY